MVKTTNYNLIKTYLERRYKIINCHEKLPTLFDFQEINSLGVVTKWNMITDLIYLFRVERTIINEVFKDMVEDKLKSIVTTQISFYEGNNN